MPKTLFLSLALSLLAVPHALAGTHTTCQARLLKVASEALDKGIAPISGKIWEIREIVYNYNLPGQPRVIFISQSNRSRDEICIIDVRTTAGEETDTSCPDYQFSEIRTTCQ